MAVVIDFDALGHVGQLERIGQLAQDLAPGSLVSAMPPVERFLGIARGLVDQLAPRAALRLLDRDLALGPLAQRLLEQLALGELAVDQDPPRRRHVLVELDQEARQHLGFGHVVGMRREEARCPQFCPPRMKKAWIDIVPPLHASANMSASPSPSAWTVWLPWM